MIWANLLYIPLEIVIHICTEFMYPEKFSISKWRMIHFYLLIHCMKIFHTNQLVYHVSKLHILPLNWFRFRGPSNNTSTRFRTFLLTPLPLKGPVRLTKWLLNDDHDPPPPFGPRNFLMPPFSTLIFDLSRD